MSSLYETVKFLTSLNPARSHENTDSLDKAAEFIKSKFQEYSLECELQEYSARDRNYKNIIGSINTHFGKRLIIGAHYDVCGEMQGIMKFTTKVSTKKKNTSVPRQSMALMKM